MAKTDANPAPSGYHAHRERQGRRILDAAERLFDEHGMDRVTMADITSASGVRASTIYQYFSHKDEIVWAILHELFTQDVERANKRMESATTGLGKIMGLLDFMADELATNPAKVRFLVQFDALHGRDWPAERLLTLEAQINPKGFRYFRQLICDGIADGSLRPDLDPDLTMQAVLNALIGAQRRLASLGNKIEIEYGQPIDRLFRETIRLLVLRLRAPESATNTKPSGRLPVRPNTIRKRAS